MADPNGLHPLRSACAQMQLSIEEGVDMVACYEMAARERAASFRALLAWSSANNKDHPILVLDVRRLITFVIAAFAQIMW